MKIDSSNGFIHLTSGCIHPKIDRLTFLASLIGKSAKNSFANGSWRHYQIDPEPEISGTLVFDGELLDRVFLSMSVPSDKEQVWSEAVEMQRKEKHDAWLRAELGGPPYVYSWGRVASEYDSKGCASEIIIVYER